MLVLMCRRGVPLRCPRRLEVEEGYRISGGLMARVDILSRGAQVLVPG